jgi:hypothetical protein
VGAIQGLINVAEIGVIFHQCDPPRRLWDMEVPGTCNLIETCLYIGYAQGGMFLFHLIQGKGIDRNRNRCACGHLFGLLSSLYYRTTSADETFCQGWTVLVDEWRCHVSTCPSSYSLCLLP